MCARVCGGAGVGGGGGGGQFAHVCGVGVGVQVGVFSVTVIGQNLFFNMRVVGFVIGLFLSVRVRLSLAPL